MYTCLNSSIYSSHQANPLLAADDQGKHSFQKYSNNYNASHNQIEHT